MDQDDVDFAIVPQEAILIVCSHDVELLPSTPDIKGQTAVGRHQTAAAGLID
jgi:hypothetical protein